MDVYISNTYMFICILYACKLNIYIALSIYVYIEYVFGVSGVSAIRTVVTDAA